MHVALHTGGQAVTLQALVRIMKTSEARCFAIVYAPPQYGQQVVCLKPSRETDAGGQGSRNDQGVMDRSGYYYDSCIHAKCARASLLSALKLAHQDTRAVE
jgi:hypothetical protein